jgi:hypothetical protein
LEFHLDLLKHWEGCRERVDCRRQHFRVETIFSADQEFDIRHSAGVLVSKSHEEFLDLETLELLNRVAF